MRQASVITAAIGASITSSLISGLIFGLVACSSPRSVQEAPSGPQLAVFAPTPTPADPPGKLPWGVTDIKEWKRHYAQANTAASVALKKEDPLAENLRSMIKAAEKLLETGYTTEAVAKIEREGVLPNDERYVRSSKALADLSVLFKWVLCARVADARLSTRCEAAARTGLLNWVTSYKPSGNPINDNELMPLFMSFDLFASRWTEQERQSVNGWLLSFAKRGDSYIAKQTPKANSRRNNHNTWRLAIRGTVARILNRNDLEAETLRLIARQAQANLVAPKGWKPDPKCKNSRTELRYGSLDFRQRDALHYHAYNLNAWAWIALLTPESLDQNLPTVRPERSVRQTLLEAIEFLRPYYLGERQHLEFICSRVAFDVERKKAGMPHFQNQEWKPASRTDRTLVLLSGAFPEIVPWIDKTRSEDAWSESPVTLLLSREKDRSE